MIFAGEKQTKLVLDELVKKQDELLENLKKQFDKSKEAANGKHTIFASK